MIEAASKYSTLPDAKARRAAPSVSSPSPPNGGEGRAAGEASAQDQNQLGAVPILKRPIWKDLDASAQRIHAMNQGEIKARGCQILIPKYRTTMSQGDWRWRELREGGCLHAYLNRMRATTKRRWEAVGRARHGFKQNPKSDFQLLASVPAYDYFRWTRQDRNFFRDPKNLRALKRDNPHVTSVFV